MIGVVSLLIGAITGASFGLLAGAFGGWVDSLVMRITDIMLSVPGLLLALSIAAVIGQSQTSIIVAVAVPNIPLFARLLTRPDVGRAAEGLRRLGRVGRRAPTVIVDAPRVPHSLAPMLVQASLALSTAIIDAAALSFLGLGSPTRAWPNGDACSPTDELPARVAPHLAISRALPS